jgi:hypothetical protein
VAFVKKVLMGVVLHENVAMVQIFLAFGKKLDFAQQIIGHNT